MIDRRCQRKGLLVIMNCRGVTFCFLMSLLFLCVLLFVGYRGWKHTGGGQKCCHIILFFRGVHVWTSTMVILEHIFSIFLHNMVNYNISIKKKIPFSNLYCVIPKYICDKKMYIITYSKNANIYFKWLEWFLVFIKNLVSIKHCDFIWLD